MATRRRTVHRTIRRPGALRYGPRGPILGRYSGYPAVRLFSAWNEPNLEQFLAPQFDSAGRSVGHALYAPLARAVYTGVKRGNPHALVAIGETSPRGHDVPKNDRVQDSHSPARFVRLLSEAEPPLRFDAWAQHPYPPQPPDRPGEAGSLYASAPEPRTLRHRARRLVRTGGNADLDHGIRT